MNELQRIIQVISEQFAQRSPLGLTIGQLFLLICGPVIVVVGFLVLRFAATVGDFVIRIGCALVVLFGCGAVSVFIFFQVAARR